MTAGLADAVARSGRISRLVEEIVLQVSANSLRKETIKEAESLPDEQRREFARTLFRYNLNIALIYNANANIPLGPNSEKPYGV